jgi:hypothetical protein
MWASEALKPCAGENGQAMDQRGRKRKARRVIMEDVEDYFRNGHCQNPRSRWAHQRRNGP